MSHYGKYDDDRKRSKTRNDNITTPKYSDKYSASNIHHRSHRENKDDEYYNSSSSSHKRSRSRSRSKSRFNSERTSQSMQSVSQQQKPQRSTINKHEEQSNILPTTPVTFSNNMISRSFNPGTPSRTIMLRQLPLQMEDQELRNEFNLMCIPVKDVRLVRNRETGQSRGFAFIEFNTVEEAQNWMTSTLGCVVFSNYSNKVQLFYSHSGDENNSFRSDKQSTTTDWECAKCGIKNFKRRDKCFKCGITREESERRSGGDGYDHVGSTPCNTLLLRGLDALTNEETVIDVLNRFTNNCIHIKNCHIARDVLTNVSCGFAFIELSSIQDSTNLLQILQPNFEADGKQVTCVYSKNSFKTALTQLEISSRLSYQPLASDINYSSYHQVNNKTNQADQANSAASIAQAALANMHKKQEMSSYLTTHMKHHKMLGSGADGEDTALSNSKLPKFSPPDMSTFTYDETSGYYYDYTTGFYYDQMTQYYFNPMTQQYMYWDAIMSTYIPVTGSMSQTTNADIPIPIENSSAETTEIVIKEPVIIEEEKKPTKPAIKTAAQIAKDMEKWAQSQNKKKETVKKPTNTSTIIAAKPEPTSSKFYSVVAVAAPIESVKEPDVPDEPMMTSNEDIIKKTIEENQESLAQKNKLSNDVGSSTVSEAVATNFPFNESSLVDINKLACLLCKRRFDSLDILNKHIAKSDLHKKNLENYKKEHSIETLQEESNKTTQSESDSLLVALQYRDRAKERRNKYGVPEPPSPTYSSSSASAYKSKVREEPVSISVEKNNTESVASKLMKKMGYVEGSGIGKNLQGISAPIEATIRAKGAGLGASNYEMDPNDNYRDAARKSARARFESLN